MESVDNPNSALVLVKKEVDPEDEEDYEECGILPDSGCKEACPIDIITQFLQSVMAKKYVKATKLCKEILKYEPENKIVKEFDSVLKEALSESSSEEEDDDGSDSSDSGRDDDNDSLGLLYSDNDRDSTYSTGDEEDAETLEDGHGDAGGSGSAYSQMLQELLPPMPQLSFGMEEGGAGDSSHSALEHFFDLGLGPGPSSSIRFGSLGAAAVDSSESDGSGSGDDTGGNESSSTSSDESDSEESSSSSESSDNDIEGSEESESDNE